MNIYDILPKPDLFSFKHVLCVQPHPDDNEIGAGATIALMAQKGIKISYLTISKGKGGTNVMSSQELVKQRQNELRAAGEVLGATYFEQLDLSDAHYPNERTLTEHIVEVIRRLKPDLLLTIDPHLPYEAHPTHRNTGMGVLDASLFASMKHFPTPDGVNSPPHQVAAIAFYATAQPNTLVDVSTSFDLKLQAIRKHASQFNETEFNELATYLRFRASLDGATLGVALAERFKVLPIALTHMMVESQEY
jgi:LmbE family N-acetylglucosaminyl deacetylase